MVKRMKEIFLAHHQKPMAEQKKALKAALRQWMKDQSQIDDILVIGIYIHPHDFQR
ncbi:MAG: hypothetical protein HC880_04375 [Bacteroidia bacterium]|nr:hypothetical protein [Bacteroidia bacterium]